MTGRVVPQQSRADPGPGPLPYHTMDGGAPGPRELQVEFVDLRTARHPF
jgi:hypothetical protein